MYRSAIEHHEEIFWVSAPKKIWGPKTTYFSQYLQQGTQYRQSGNGVRNYEGSPISSQNLMNFGPLMAKNRTVLFTFQNHHLLDSGGYHVGLPLGLGMPTFLVIIIVSLTAEWLYVGGWLCYITWS